MIIIESNIDDLDYIYNLSLNRIKNSTLTKDELKSYYQDNNVKILKIVNNSLLIIGYAIIRISIDEAEIDEIAIDKNNEGHGYGTLLLKEIDNLLISKNIKNIFLEVRSKNIRAINLYIKNNYKEYRLRKNYYIDDDALCLVKEL